MNVLFYVFGFLDECDLILLWVIERKARVVLCEGRELEE